MRCRRSSCGPSRSKRPQALAGQCGHGQGRRGQQGGAESVDVLDRLAEPADEVLVEHAQDDADAGVQAADHESAGDIDQVVAGEDEHAAGVGGAGLFEHLALPAIALDQREAEQARIAGLALAVDDDDGQTGRLEVLQHPGADPAHAANKDRLFHGSASLAACIERPPLLGYTMNLAPIPCSLEERGG